MKTRVHRLLLRLLHIRPAPPHPRVAGERAAYYFDPAELGVTTTSATDESW